MSPTSVTRTLKSKSALSTVSAVARSTIIEKLRGDSTFVQALKSCQPTAKKSLAQEKLYLESVRCANESILRARCLGIIPSSIGTIRVGVDLNRIEFQTFRLRGLDHHEHQQPCQDIVLCQRSPQSIIAVVSDGAGAVPLSHLGANLLAQESIRILSELLDSTDLKQKRTILDPYLMGALHARLLNFMHEINQELEINDFDAYCLFWAATLQILIITPKETLVLALGDGYLKWQGHYTQIEKRIGRSEELCGLNYPPLLASQLALNDPDARGRSDTQARLREELFNESRAFSVVAYGATKQILSKEIVLATDGLRFASDLGAIARSWSGLTIDNLLKRYGAAEAEQILLLMSLSVSKTGSSKRDSLFADIAKCSAGKSGPAGLIATRINDLINGDRSEQITELQQETIIAVVKRLLNDVYGIKVRPDFEGLWDDLALVKVWTVARTVHE